MGLFLEMSMQIHVLQIDSLFVKRSNWRYVTDAVMYKSSSHHFYHITILGYHHCIGPLAYHCNKKMEALCSDHAVTVTQPINIVRQTLFTLKTRLKKLAKVKREHVNI